MSRIIACVHTLNQRVACNTLPLWVAKKLGDAAIPAVARSRKTNSIAVSAHHSVSRDLEPSGSLGNPVWISLHPSQIRGSLAEGKRPQWRCQSPPLNRPTEMVFTSACRHFSAGSPPQTTERPKLQLGLPVLDKDVMTKAAAKVTYLLRDEDLANVKTAPRGGNALPPKLPPSSRPQIFRPADFSLTPASEQNVTRPVG